MSAIVTKDDYRGFLNHLDDLKKQAWLGSRQWWPDFLFHFTDVKNVASILNEGLLRSRNELRRLNLNWQDAASKEIIEQTDTDLIDYVRFYFRPLTPTAYRNEGFRPKAQLYQTAHCPVPVYLLFDHRDIISLDETWFSNGSLARQGYELYRSAIEYSRLDFEKIYHNQWFSEEEKRDIINCRHAEVIHPRAVSLDHLRYICCRSQAEYETLRNLLSPVIWNKWRSLIRTRNPHLLFSLKWLHVTKATLTAQSIAFEFHAPTSRLDCGPFEIRVDIYDSRSSDSFNIEVSYENILEGLPSLRLNVDLKSIDLVDYRVILTIDKNLAYAGTYTDDRIPF